MDSHIHSRRGREASHVPAIVGRRRMPRGAGHDMPSRVLTALCVWMWAGAGDTSSIWLGAQDVVTDHRGAARQAGRRPLEAARDVAARRADGENRRDREAAARSALRFFALAWQMQVDEPVDADQKVVHIRSSQSTTGRGLCSRQRTYTGAPCPSPGRPDRPAARRFGIDRVRQQRQHERGFFERVSRAVGLDEQLLAPPARTRGVRRRECGPRADPRASTIAWPVPRSTSTGETSRRCTHARSSAARARRARRRSWRVQRRPAACEDHSSEDA